MADRYWVGGTANWDGTAGTKWATTSGGAGGAAVPTSADNVFFDAASGAVTVTISGASASCNDLDCTGFTGTLAGTTQSLNIFGNCALVAGMTYTYNSTVSFKAVATGKTITSGGKAFSGVAFDGSGGGWTIVDAFSSGAGAITLSQGALDTNGQAITAAGITSTGNGVRTLTLGASTLNLSGGSPINFSGSNFTFNAGTSTINCSSTGATLSGNNQTFATVNFTGASTTTRTISGSNTFGALSFTNGASSAVQIVLGGDQTITGTLTCNGNSAANRPLIRSSVVGTPRTISAGTFSPTDVDFRDIAGTGAAAPFAGTRLGDCKGNSGITFTAAANKYWVGDTGNWNSTSWATSSGGSAAANNYPLPQDTVIFDANSFSANGHTVTLNGNMRIGSVSFADTDQTFTLACTSTPEFYGDFTFDSNGTISGASTYTYMGRNTQLVDMAGKALAGPATLASPGGTLKLVSAFSTSPTNFSFNHERGTLDLNGQDLSCWVFNTNSGITREIKSSVAGGKIITLATTAGTVMSASAGGLTITRNSWTVEISGNTTNVRTFNGAGLAWPAVVFTNTTAGGGIDFQGSNTFKSLTNSGGTAQTARFTAATTTTIEDSGAAAFFKGSSGNVITIGSITAASHTLAKSGGGVIESDWLSISRSTATPGSTWYAGTNSTDGGNNSGWSFTDAPVTLFADAGSLTITGTAASLEYGKEIAAGSGSFTITGTATGLIPGKKLAAGSGSFTLTGQSATLTYGEIVDVLNAEGGSISIIGTAMLMLAEVVPEYCRQPAVVADFDQDFCQNTYGVSPCTAGRIDIGTAQGGTANTIDLDTSASAENDAYNNMVVRIVSGTGAGQERVIEDYVGATGVATVTEDWATNPDGTSVYHIINRPAACFHGFNNCQDTDNYIKGTRTVYFCKPTQRLPIELAMSDGVTVIPSIVELQQTPTRLNTGGSSKSSGALGTRGSVAISFKDHPSSDLQLDPYVKNRPYDPMTRGTWWTKFIARNPYYEGRPLRVRIGRVGQSLSEMNALHYLMDRIVGPDTSRRVSLSAFDRLRLVDGERAQCPRLSKGELDVAINNSVNTFTVTGTTIAADYESPAGTVRIGDEVITYTGISELAGVITFTGCTRGSDNTDPDAHDEGDQVQRCVRYTAARPVDVVYDQFTSWSDVEAQYLDYHAWDDESNTWLVGFEVTALITEPTPVSQLLDELCEQVQIFMWWDERDQLVKLRALRAPVQAPEEVNEDEHIIAGSHGFKQDPTQRFNEIWIYYAQIDPTKRLEDTNNYAQTRVKIDEEASGVNAFNDSKTRIIFSRWLRGASQVNDVQTRLLARYRNTPVLGSLVLDGKDRDRWWTGDLLNVRTRLLTDETGASVARQFQVVAAQEDPGMERFRFDLQNYELLALRQGRYMADDAPDYDGTNVDATVRATGAWYADENGLIFGNEGYEYQ